MTIFSSERDMQNWLDSLLQDSECFVELIPNRESFEEHVPKNYAEARVVEAIEKVLSSLKSVIKICADENIACTDGEVLRPDFVLYAPDTQSLVIVELKNLISPSRQAGTELAAYSAGVRKFIPLLAEGDIAHVLISSVWPTLLRHYARDQILWQGRNLLCLRPVVDEDNTISLEIVGAEEITGNALEYSLNPEQVGGYQICLYDYHQRGNFNQYESQFRSALQRMANEGNRQRSHGFAYLWRDRKDSSLAPYSITCMNVAPFVIHSDSPDLDEIFNSPFLTKMLNVVDDFRPAGHGESLRVISDAGSKIVDTICEPRYEGFFSWDHHRIHLQQNAEKVAFIGWGIFGDAFFSELENQYAARQDVNDVMNPTIGDFVVDSLIKTRRSVVLALDGVANLDKAIEIDRPYICPPAKCDMCDRPLSKEKYFIDGKILGSSSWANMCGHCHKIHGIPMGWGSGQLYKNMGEQGWLQVAGFPEGNDGFMPEDPDW